MLQWNCSISTGRELNYSSMNISLQSLWRMNLSWNLFLAVIRSNNSAGARNAFSSLLLIRYTWTLPEAIPYRWRWSHVSLLFSSRVCLVIWYKLSRITYYILFLIVLSWLSLDAAQHGQVQAGKYFGHGTWGILGKCHIMAKINRFSFFFSPQKIPFFFCTVDSCQLCVVFDWTWRSERLLLEKLKELLYNGYRRQGWIKIY